MVTPTITRTAQRTQGSCQGRGAKSNSHGSNAKSLTISEYLKTRDALWRMLACYPPKMPFTQAVLLAQTDFTKYRKGGEV